MKAETVKELLAWQAPKVEQLIGGGMLHPGSRMILFGRWGTYKSMLAQHTAFCLTNGKNWLGHSTTRCTVLYAQVEIPKAMMQERIKKYVENNDVKQGDLWVLTDQTLRLDRAHSFQTFQLICQVHRPRVVILDPVYRMFSGDITDNFAIQQMLDKLDNLAAACDLSYILIGHTRKPAILQDESTRDWGQELIGGSYIMDWVDTAVAVELLSDSTIKLHYSKVRHAETMLNPQIVKFDRDSLGFRLAL